MSFTITRESVRLSEHDRHSSRDINSATSKNASSSFRIIHFSRLFSSGVPKDSLTIIRKGMHLRNRASWENQFLIQRCTECGFANTIAATSLSLSLSLSLCSIKFNTSVECGAFLLKTLAVCRVGNLLGKNSARDARSENAARRSGDREFTCVGDQSLSGPWESNFSRHAAQEKSPELYSAARLKQPGPFKRDVPRLSEIFIRPRNPEFVIAAWQRFYDTAANDLLYLGRLCVVAFCWFLRRLKIISIVLS